MTPAQSPGSPGPGGQTLDMTFEGRAEACSFETSSY